MVSDDQGNKVKTSISISIYLFRRMEELVENKTFASKSDIITTALSEFFGRMDERENRKNTDSKSIFINTLELLMQSEQGKEALKETLSKLEGNKNNNSNEVKQNRLIRSIIIE